MKLCNVEGCDTPILSRGYCNAHYIRVRKYGSPKPETPVTKSNWGQTNSNWRGGKSTHPLIHIYRDLVRRCENPNHLRYSSYGGRGIRVHKAWLDDFWQFVEDVGPRPEGKTSGGRAYWQLDRIDNDGNYEPGNVRWATPHQQANNKRGFGDYESRRNTETGRFE